MEMLEYFYICHKSELEAFNMHSLGSWEGIGQVGFNPQMIDHFTVVCLVAWPLNENEAGVDLVLIETSLLFLC